MNNKRWLFSLMVACSVALTCLGCSAGSSSDAASVSSSESSSAAVASAEASASQTVSDASESAASPLDNGMYTVDVETDSSMFHLNEACEGKGQLTVTDEGMTVHISLVSKKITNVYAGTAKQAQSDETGIIEPTLDKMTYSDGSEKEVYGFDIPVPALDQEFEVAILGSKGNWYDHKVIVSNPVSA